MEHNEYAIYKVTFKKSIRPHDKHSLPIVVEETVNLVAPENETISIPLIEYTLRPHSWSNGEFKIISLVKEKLDHIIRFENAYRARL